MANRLGIRNKINLYKEEYKRTEDIKLLLTVAIYKGMYIALGGKKGITLPSKYDNIVIFSKIIFNYKIKLNSNKDISYAIRYLLKNMRENFRKPEFYLKEQIPVDNISIATLLADIITDDYSEDLVINKHNIMEIALEALEQI